MKESPASFTSHRPVEMVRYVKQLKRTILNFSEKQALDPVQGKWITENWRLITTAIGECSDSARALAEAGKSGKSDKSDQPQRVLVIADEYIEKFPLFDAQTLVDFVCEKQDQEMNSLQMDEIWALKPALQLILLEMVSRCVEGADVEIADVVNSIRKIGSAEWKDIFEAINAVDRILMEDPTDTYGQMDFESKDLYRSRVSEASLYSHRSETEVARTALALAQEQVNVHYHDERLKKRRSHIGYFLLDDGFTRLKNVVGYHAPASKMLEGFALSFPKSFYMIGVELLTLALVFWICTEMGSPQPLAAVIALLIIPATHAAVHFMNSLAGLITKPRALPRMDFSEKIPDEFATAIAVPVLLTSEKQVNELVRDLHIRYLANPDPNLLYVLLSDAPDSMQEFDEKDELAAYARNLIEELNTQHGPVFYMLHRHRSFNEAEGKWMGWERKRGKLVDFNQYLRSSLNPFPVVVGDVEKLRRVVFVLTLDSDTQLPRGSAAKLIATLAHPLNRAIIDPSTNMVVEGYGILQPRIGVSIQSASRSWLANIYSGQTGFDIYTRAVSDVYQDLFGEAIFTGKGIYEVDVFHTVLEKRFPNNTLLSHDLIEGAYARTGLVTDVELIDDFPSHFSAYCRRQHRWVRGDWQVLRWLLPVVSDFHGNPIVNPISVLSGWKILDNLRRSLIHPAALALLLAGWFWFSGSAVAWTLVSLGLFLIPAFSQLFFALLRFPKTGIGFFLKDVMVSLFKDSFMAVLQFVFLIHQSLLSLDAIIRSLSRTMKGRRLLEWETAAESEAARKKAPVDIYLEWTPYISLLIGGLVVWLKPESLVAALPVIALWFFSRMISNWLNAQPEPVEEDITEAEEQRLRIDGLLTWRFFVEFSHEGNHWLIPDNVRQDGLIPANRISPTNIGLLLNSRIAAVEMGWLTLDEFADFTQKTLESMLRMERYRGNFLNWYSTDDLRALTPRFVSSVDSGNLAVCLWTLKQFALRTLEQTSLIDGIRDHIALISELEPQHTRGLNSSRKDTFDLDEVDRQAALLLNEESLSPEANWWVRQLRLRILRSKNTGQAETLQKLNWIASVSQKLVHEMEFGFMYLPKKKALSVGFHVEENKLETSAYDVLASEARSAAFVAIAKNEIPQMSWFHLSRAHTICQGRKVLVSWSGTMFEYLMPMIWMRHYPNTLLESATREIVAAQQKYGAEHEIPWGISESAYGYGDRNQEYSYHAFGLPDAALNAQVNDPKVVAPYATFLALPVDPKESFRNLQRMKKQGWMATYGYFEAIDFSPERADVLKPYSIVRAWMVHHHGMSLLALCNFIRNNSIQEYFHMEPAVEATERILQERMPRNLQVEPQPDTPQLQISPVTVQSAVS